MSLAAAATVIIDGSVLEGGGQILRNCTSLSALLGKPLSIHNIRHARKPPGLKNQHRTGLELAAHICNAQLTGATNGSASIGFTPGRLALPGAFTADSVTAGSTTLLLQTALPLLLFAPAGTPRSTLTLLGGTNASQAPQIDYTQHVFLPFLRQQFGLAGELELEIVRRGYFPRGGGEVRVAVAPVQRLGPLRVMERGRVVHVGGVAHVAGLPLAVGRKMMLGARRRLGELPLLNGGEGGEVTVDIQVTRERNEVTKGAGSGIVLWAELAGGGVIGGSGVGRKGLDPHDVGAEAAAELLRGLEAGGCVDEWLQDQLVIFMALAEGTSEIRCGKGGLSLHTQTAIWVAQQMTDAQFEVEEEASGDTVIRCRGIGYSK